ncbi:protein trichome birefringence-like 5 [Phtheirospermum japonicum]|uniref:Protein trichome birefringence-like 5 n=1 Tax=Phtheirospermum japonicum TaxID=374723 RepID=A0A830CJJ1_9LAMI|nr:protein trichome birefringence-like 5 [Phtheirospermum japonicum]
MAMPSSSVFPKKRNRCTLPTFSVLLLFLFSLFFFTRRVLEPKNFIYRDLIPQTPVLHLSPPRSTEFVEKFDDLRKTVSYVSDPVEDINENNITLSSELPGPEFQEENNEESPKFENTGPLVSSDPESEDDLGEITDEPISSNEQTNVSILSKSDLDEEKLDEDAPSSDTVKTEGGVDDVMAEKWQNCDFYQGRWVKDENYPLYSPGSCPYVDDGFDCQRNGRSDSEYLKWRWKPDECDLPRFNATDFLVRLRGKKLMLVGDSMNRNQFESLLCLLREGLPDKSKMYEVHGYKISKGRGYFVFKFEDYDCTVEFVRSHFLVREGVRINAQGNSNPTLSIDRIDKTARRWQRADILVFNTGHWWTHGKTSRGGGDWDSGGSCNGETEPVKSGPIIDSYPQKMIIVEDVFKETKVPAMLLNVTRLTNFRKDGHPSVYGKNVTGGKKVSTRRQDCSHWCLPGVPDAWNELIYATLVAKQT